MSASAGLITEDQLDTGSYLDKVLLGKEVEEPETPKVEEPEKPEEPKVEEPETPKAEEKPEEPAKPEEDVFDSIKLSPHARPSTAESFTKVKELARAEVSKVRQEVEQLRSQLEEAKRTPGTVAPDEKVLKELEELRNFRESVALEGDPVFKERFDTKLEEIDGQIYDRLKQAGATDADIEKIKQLGGVEALDLEKLAPDPRLRRFVETRLAKKDEIREERTQAVSRGAETRKKFLQEQTESQKKATQKLVEESTAEFDRLAKELDGFKTIEVPKEATPEQKATIENANRYIASKIEDARKLLGTDNPKTRGELAAGYALAHVFLTERDGLAKQVAQLRKQLAEADKRVRAAIGAGKTVRTDTARSSAPAKPAVDLRPAGEALDAHFKGKV